MGASGDDTTLYERDSGSARDRSAGLSMTARPAITRECDYANETDPHHTGAGGGCCCGGYRCGTNGRGRAGGGGGGGDDQPVHDGGNPGCPGRLPRWRRRLPRRRLPRWRRSRWIPRQSLRLGLEPLGLGPALLTINDDGGSGVSTHRLRHRRVSVCPAKPRPTNTFCITPQDRDAC
jgi:hypothetical protein